jgi:hypothetical protein
LEYQIRNYHIIRDILVLYRWDEKVPESRCLKYNQVKLELQQELTILNSNQSYPEEVNPQSEIIITRFRKFFDQSISMSDSQ